MLEPSSRRGCARPMESYRPPVSGESEDLERLLAEWPLESGGRFGCYFIADSSPYSDLARRLECCVFQQFFGNDPATMVAEYGPYEEHSSFFLVVDRELLQPAGALRVIAHSVYGLKTLNDIARPPLSISLEEVIQCHRIADLDKCWDVGTVAVRKDYRGAASHHLVSTLLYALLRSEANRAGVEHLVAVLDTHAYQQIVQTIGVPFVPIAESEPFEYLGSANSLAVELRVAAIVSSIEEHMRRMDGALLQLMRPLLERVAYGSGLPYLVRVT